MRRAGGRLDVGRRLDERPSAPEEAAARGLHLASSSAIGALCGAFHRRLGPSVVPSGLLLEPGFYPLAFGGAGPLRGIMEEPWEVPPRLLGRRGLLHAVFGAVTALATKRIVRRPDRPVRR